MAQLTKKDLVTRIAEETGVAKKTIEAVLKAEHTLIPTMLGEVRVEDANEKSTLALTGFGTYTISYVPERDGKSPKTGETIKIPASYRVRFSAGSKTKEFANA